MSQPIIESHKIATRQAYGTALVRLGQQHTDIVVLDAETSNSTFAEAFKTVAPERFLECYIAEQNMVSMALGLSRRGKVPFVSTFAAFFSRAYDQIRMSQYSDPNIKLVGSHCGVSIGVDGSSQMALEDLAMMRSVSEMVVLYPSDAVAMNACVELAYNHHGNVYIRSTREATETIYSSDQKFQIGGSQTVYSSKNDTVTVIGAGITLHEAIKAYQELFSNGITIRVIDLYSIKPLDKETIAKACQETQALIVVEDHHPEGGIYEAVCGHVCGAACATIPVYSLAVTKPPRSGSMQELLRYEEIDAQAIVELTTKIVLKN
jgi:transketolase